MTRIELAKRGIITDEFKEVSLTEGIPVEDLTRDIADGRTVIARNNQHAIRPVGIGRGMRVKVNTNIGTSKDKVSVEEEMEKLRALVKYGSDAVMDLSTGGPIKEIRRALLSESPIPVGTVPIYEAMVAASERYGRIADMTVDDLFDVIEGQAKEGVDFITVHSGLTRKAIERLREEGRILDIVSRGGAFLLEWMIYNDRENPLYENFDRLLEIAKRYDMTLSLGDGLRPGCLADATDRAQVEELLTIGELHDYALTVGVQTIIEGPGHVPLNQVELNIRIQKEICKGAPF
ncbi:MAG: phosphomethylpyrimidine synthase ThiC, partial [Thermodesulfovibrionales bacterium]